MDGIAFHRKEYMMIIALLVVLIIVAIFVMKPQRYFDRMSSMPPPNRTLQYSIPYPPDYSPPIDNFSNSQLDAEMATAIKSNAAYIAKMNKENAALNPLQSQLIYSSSSPPPYAGYGSTPPVNKDILNPHHTFNFMG